MNSIELFRIGYDSREIANLLRVKEAEIYNEIHRLREKERGNPDFRSYCPAHVLHVVKPKPQTKLIRYAGYDAKERL